MRVLVTGGAGFIGSHVVEQALAAGLEVAVLDNLSTGRRENVPAGVKLFEVDLRDREATFAAVRDFRPALVSHQAAQASVPVSVKEPTKDVAINVLGGLNLLDAFRNAKSPVERFVFASTGGAIYGEVAEGERASEDHAFAPKSPYAVSKLAFEQLLKVYREHHGLRSSVLRYANVYGPRQDPAGEAGVVAIFFDAALAGRPVRVFARREVGDGGCLRDYVYVGDVARANLLALTGDTLPPVMNVGTGVITTTDELASAIGHAVGRELVVEQGPVRPGDVGRSVLDPKVCERALGALTPLARGLAETVAWYRAR